MLKPHSNHSFYWCLGYTCCQGIWRGIPVTMYHMVQCNMMRMTDKCPLLTHWGRATHIFVSETIIIGSDYGLSPGWRQAIIWTNVAIFLIGPLGTSLNEISLKINTFSFKKMHLKMSSAEWCLVDLSLNDLTNNTPYLTSAVSCGLSYMNNLEKTNHFITELLHIDQVHFSRLLTYHMPHSARVS